jgi:hypothetical protein
LACNRDFANAHDDTHDKDHNCASKFGGLPPTRQLAIGQSLRQGIIAAIRSVLQFEVCAAPARKDSSRILRSSVAETSG